MLPMDVMTPSLLFYLILNTSLPCGLHVNENEATVCQLDILTTLLILGVSWVMKALPNAQNLRRKPPVPSKNFLLLASIAIRFLLCLSRELT